MVSSTLRNFMRVSAIALIASTAAGSTLVLTADAAYAERGGNGNGNGRGNGGGNGNGRDHARGNNGNGNGNGRGALARELGGLNAAHANQRALENASPNSMPGKLYAYQQAQLEIEGDIEAAQAEEAAAQREYDRLIGLSEDEIAAEFPDGGYEDAVTDAANTLLAAQDNTADALARENENLAILTNGQILSDAALAELNRLLGL